MRYRNQLVALTLLLGLVFLMPWKAIGDGATSIAKSMAVTQSGTWTVQPGNTANTTAWKVDGSAVTQPVSLASVPSHAVTNAGTFATQADTELPAAGALADATSNPTVPGVASFNMCWNASTWDRCLTSAAGAGNSNSSTQRTVEATDSQLSAGVGATGDAAVTAGSTGSITGKLRQISSDIDAIKTAVQLIDDDQTGASLDHYVSVGTTEDEHQVKATAGRLLSISITNSAATVAYFRCTNLTAANTTPGTSTVFYGLAVPGATTGAGMTVNFGPMGIAFSTALTCYVVTGKAETDVAEVGANDIQWNIQYK